VGVRLKLQELRRKEEKERRNKELKKQTGKIYENKTKGKERKEM
jgi:hypothetical protein